MKELFLQSDLVICAGGSILYELAVTGTPALVIPMNDHQVENGEEFTICSSKEWFLVYEKLREFKNIFLV